MERKVSTKMLAIGFIFTLTAIIDEKIYFWFSWSFQLMLLSRLIDFNETYYREVKEDYPKEEYIMPKYTKYFFEYIEPNIGLPKELVYEMWREIGILVSVVIVTLNANLFSEYIIVCIAWVAGLIMSVLSDVYCICKLYKKAFLNKYIKLTSRNFKYLILMTFYPSYNQPPITRMGKCHIQLKYRIGKEAFVDVKIIDTGEVLKKISISRYEEVLWNQIYEVCELCNIICVKKDDEALMQAEVRGSYTKYLQQEKTKKRAQK